MKDIIAGLLNIIAEGFDKIPLLNRFKGYRSVIGFVALAVLGLLDALKVGGGELFSTYSVYLIAFTGLALNAAGRDEMTIESLTIKK